MQDVLKQIKARHVISGRQIILMLMCGALVTTSVQAQDAAENRHSFAKIQQAWRERQNKVRTAEFQWSEKHFWPRNSLRSGGTFYPKTDTWWRVASLIAVDGPRMRHEYDGNRPNSTDDSPVPQHLVSVFDGVASKTLKAPSNRRANHRGVIVDEDKNARADSMEVLPILWALRPDDYAGGSLNLSQYKLSSTEAQLTNGDACVVLVSVNGRGLRRELWLDPAQAYSIRRYSSFRRDGTLSRQYEIDYAQNATSDAWLPTRWQIVSSSAAIGIQRSLTADVSNVEVNQAIPLSYFQVDFPVGATVFDQSRGSEVYLQRENGDMRRVLPAELAAGISHQELMETEPGEPLARQLGEYSAAWPVVIFSCLGALLVSIVAAWWWRKRAGNLA